MLRRSSLPSLAALFVVLLMAAFTATLLLPPTEVARGKSAAIPLSDELTPDQQRAQDLALADARVQAHTVGQRTEVFGVSKFLDVNTPLSAQGCAIENCFVVNIYNFDAAATVQAYVRLDSEEVVEVYYQPGIRPGINRRLADRAMEIALSAPEIMEVIGEQRVGSDWAPMDSTLVGSVCEQGHMCVAPTFDMGDYILWAIVDLTDETFVDTFWTATDGLGNGRTPYPEAYPTLDRDPEGCLATGSVNRNGWMLDYQTTGSDGLMVTNVRYNDSLVINSAKLAEWHADYGGSGFQDTTGCGGGGGFQIRPIGDPTVTDLTDGGDVIGFEVVQIFSMNSWGSGCNYRYDQHFQFYSDGSFRTVQGAYGKGCGQNSLYRGLMRIDLAAGGTEGNDNIAFWNGSDWAPTATETRWCPEGVSHATCTDLTPGSNPDGYRFRITDSATGTGYYMEPGRGQFGDQGQGDNEFVYAVQHKASEGDNDLGVFSAGCCNDFSHGPEQFVNGETIADSNIVIWYIPQMLTDAVAPDYYCWTLTPPETYPCFAGPMFVPTSTAPTAPPAAGFTMPDPPHQVGDVIQFTDTTVAGMPETHTWEWDFGDGDFPVYVQNPLHSFDEAGTYTVTLTVDNGVFTDSFSAPIEILEQPPTAVTLGTLAADGSKGVPLGLFAAGLLLLAGAAVTLRRR